MELPSRPTKDPYKELPIKDYSYINSQKPTRTEKRRPLIWLVIGSIVVILIIIGSLIYFHVSKTHSKNHKSQSNHQRVISKSPRNQQAPKISTPTTSYTSGVFNLSVKYPTNWTVIAQGNSSLSIYSPPMSLTEDTGKNVKGKIDFSIFNQGQIPAAFGSYSVAVLDSQDISFQTPTTNQAAQTYISFVQYPATNVKGGLDAIYVTGNNGFVKDQDITTAQVNQVSPLIIVSFEACQNSSCTSTSPLTIASTMWSDNNFSSPIINIIESLTFS